MKEKKGINGRLGKDVRYHETVEGKKVRPWILRKEWNQM